MERVLAGLAQRGGCRRINAHRRLNERRAIDRQEHQLTAAVAHVAPGVERRHDLFRHALLHGEERIILRDRAAVRPRPLRAPRDHPGERVGIREQLVLQAQRMQALRRLGRGGRNHRPHPRLREGAVE
jgi:hypothetical protein